MQMLARFSFFVLEHGKLDNGVCQNEALDALFCLINLALSLEKLINEIS
jgi:hypothetical protein